MSGFTITELTYPDSDDTIVAAENNIGQVVGIYFSDLNSGGFLYQDGQYSALQPQNLLYDQPDAINNLGDMTGANFANINGAYDFLNAPGSLGDSTFGLAINNSDTVAGFYIDSVSGRNGFLYTDGQYTEISDPNASDYTSPTAINDSGTVVGYYQDAKHYYFGFIYTNGNYSTIPMPSDAYRLTPTDINSSGEIVGFYEDVNTNFHSFFYQNGTFTTLAPLSGASYLEAIGVNDTGTIVGNYTDAAGVEQGFVYSDGNYTTIQDPNSVGETSLVAINDAGDIIGTYKGLDRKFHSFSASIACFAAGTNILTAHGEVPVENLNVGDLIITVDGKKMPVIWIGFREINCEKHRTPDQVWPILIKFGAFGLSLPKRDLLLSPNHAIFIDGILIPAKRLLSDAAVMQLPVSKITYYHLELQNHNVVLAEGLPTESYLDTGDRTSFANGPDATALHPIWSSEEPDAALIREALGYAPLKVAGVEVDRVKSRLAERHRQQSAEAMQAELVSRLQ